MYYSDIYELDPKAPSGQAWHCVGYLPTELAYGVGITVPEGLVCIGGTDGRRSYADVRLLTRTHADDVVDTPLPSLPSTSAMGPVRLFLRRDTPSISAQ